MIWQRGDPIRGVEEKRTEGKGKLKRECRDTLRQLRERLWL